MGADRDVRRPRLALPFTVLTEPGVVRLVAGEDFRYTLREAGLESWLPGLLADCDGARRLPDLLAGLPEDRRSAAGILVDGLYAERVLVDGSALEAHPGGRFAVHVEGAGALRGRIEAGLPRPTTPARTLALLCQDRLDYREAIGFSRRCRDQGHPALWVTTGPMTRGFVSPLLLPDAGPCLACLVHHFRRLSPAPEIYDALEAHSRAGKPMVPAPFPDPGLAVLEGLVRWKLQLAEAPVAAAPLYRLHVLETESLEVGSHRVFTAPDCPECGEGA